MMIDGGGGEDDDDGGSYWGTQSGLREAGPITSFKQVPGDQKTNMVSPRPFSGSKLSSRALSAMAYAIILPNK